MAKRRRRTAESPLRFILDSGAVIGESKGEPKIRALLRKALDDGAVTIVPTIVVTETYRADPTDVRLNRLFASVFVPDID